MRNRLVAIAASALVLLATASAFTSELKPGSPAPALDVKSWYKGTPVTGFETGKTYVVEFWATWCGPCKVSIPHLTELAHKNKDVSFIGVSIWEDDKDDNIKNFVAAMGDKMDYNVGYSGNKTGMAETWMTAAAQNGIPTAFVIKDQRVQWIGHPMSMEKPLEEIKNGTFDSAKFAEEFSKQAEASRKQMKLQQDLGAIEKVHKSGDKAAAAKQLDEFLAANPEMASTGKSIKFNWLSQDDPAAFKQSVDSLLATKDAKDRQVVLGFVLRQASKGGDAALGKEILVKALKATGKKDFLTLNYASVFYSNTKSYKEAIEALDLMLAQFDSSPYKDNKDFKESLVKQKSELEAKLKG